MGNESAASWVALWRVASRDQKKQIPACYAIDRQAAGRPRPAKRAPFTKASGQAGRRRYEGGRGPEGSGQRLYGRWDADMNVGPPLRSACEGLGEAASGCRGRARKEFRWERLMRRKDMCHLIFVTGLTEADSARVYKRQDSSSPEFFGTGEGGSRYGEEKGFEEGQEARGNQDVDAGVRQE